MLSQGGHVRFTRFAAAIVMLACAPRPARAEGFLIPFIGYNFGGDSANCQSLTNCEEKHTNFGVSIGSMGTLFGIEEDIGYAKNFFGQTPGTDSNVFSAMTNLMAGVGVGPVQPYALVGIGLIRPHVSLNPTQVGEKNGLGYDVGGGVNVFPSKHLGVRGDIRHFHTFTDVTVPLLGTTITNEKLNWWRASLGLALRF
jgi:opacity protein-like surface antigen